MSSGIRNFARLDPGSGLGVGGGERGGKERLVRR